MYVGFKPFAGIRRILRALQYGALLCVSVYVYTCAWKHFSRLVSGGNVYVIMRVWLYVCMRRAYCSLGRFWVVWGPKKTELTSGMRFTSMYVCMHPKGRTYALQTAKWIRTHKHQQKHVRTYIKRQVIVVWDDCVDLVHVGLRIVNACIHMQYPGEHACVKSHVHVYMG